VYSSQSLYKVINFSGVTSVHVPAVWALKISPRVHFFLWLLSKNKLLTRDNLSISRKVEDPSCLFCSEAESIQHLFFECVVAKQLWAVMSEVLNRQVGSDFISVGTLWLSNKKFVIANSVCATAPWGLWKLRNSLCFQGHPWKDGHVLLLMVTTMLQTWSSLCPRESVTEFMRCLDKLRTAATRAEPSQQQMGAPPVPIWH
jgi:hypothetical protein